MRIRRIQLVGLAAALAGVSAGDALAQDRTITTATTTPVETSDPDGAGPNVNPGNVTIGAGGSIAVTANNAAITVDSNNSVTVQSTGTLSSNNANNTTAILIEGGGFGGAISHAGAINLVEDHTRTDADNDGDPDGPWALGSDRIGIWLQSGAAYTGAISSSGSILIEGNNSTGILLEALLDNDLSHTGSITMIGDNTTAIHIAGGVTGDVNVAGLVNMRGANSRGLLVDGGDIDGALVINGTWSTTAFPFGTAPTNQSTLDADDLLNAGSVIEIRSSVLGGVLIDGTGVEDDEDDDGDSDIDTGTDPDADDDASAVISASGSSPAVLVASDGLVDLELGPISGGVAAGYGFHLQGAIVSSGIVENRSSTGIRFAGDSATSIVDTNAGIALDGTVRAIANEADATAVSIGEFVLAPSLRLRNGLLTTVVSEGADNAYGVRIEAGADVSNVNNSGSIASQLLGETGNAYAILDESGTVDTITNSGTIVALVVATDSTPLDNNPPPPVTGSGVAIDVSANTTGVILSQIADAPFTDEDGNDQDSASRPETEIIGEIRLGSGADTFNLLDGTVTGDVSFGNGADIFNIDNGATFTGRISDLDGALAITVTDGTLAHTGGQTNITSAYFDANSVLSVQLSTTLGQSTFINAAGTVEFVAGAELIPVVPVGLPGSGTQTILTAGTLVGGANVAGAVTGVDVPFLYDLEIQVAGNSLNALYELKTASELGLNSNQTIAFQNIIDALRLDPDAAAAMSGLNTSFDFFDAYEDLMPNYASGATELAATAIQQMQGATSNRLANTRLQGLDEVSVWAQEIGYGLTRTPATVNGLEFRGNGFGFAAGIDGPLSNGGLFGLSGSFLASEVEEPGRPEGEISAWFAQGNAYLGTAMGPFDFDFIAGGGFGKMQSRRFVEIGTTFEALSEAEWWAYEGHGLARASLPMSLSNWLVITPQAALTYVALGEQAYTEEGGGAAIDYDVDDTFSQRLWGDVGLELSTRWNLRGGGTIAPRIFAGYRANLINEAAERTVRFVSGGSDFTVTDDELGDGGPLVGLGIDATNGYSTFSLAYEGEFGDQIERHSINAAIRFRF